MSLSHTESSSILHYWPEDHTIEALTSLTWGGLSEALAPHHQGLPLCYPPHWTLLDILNADWPSITTGLAGRCPRDYVLGLSITDGTGLTTKAGGRVMKNVTGYDVCRLMIGSHHSLATISQVTLRLTTQPNSFYGYWLSCSSSTQALTLCESLLAHHRDALWACEMVCNQVNGNPEGPLVFALSTEPLTTNEWATHTIESLPATMALPIANQLSAFGWESNTAGTLTNPSILSGILAVPLGSVASAVHRLEQRLNENPCTSYQWQCRHAAGLLLFSIEAANETSTYQWETTLNSLLAAFPELTTTPKQASLRITQWPPCLTETVNSLHLPAPHSPEDRFYQGLKQLYDPHNHFQSHHLPLHLLPSPIA